MEIIFRDNTDGDVLCFRHAVKAAINEHEVLPEIDTFGADSNDLRSTWCRACEREGK